MSTNLSDSDAVRGSWTPQEDAALLKLVQQHGPRNWSVIGSGIPGRTGKSCRLRWCNQLSPSVQHRPFSPAEDEIIIKAIAKMLPGRTDNAIMNHWNSTLRKRKKAECSEASGSESVSCVKWKFVPNFMVPESSESVEFVNNGVKRRKMSFTEDSGTGLMEIETALTLSPPEEGFGVVADVNKVADDVKREKEVGEDMTCLMNAMQKMVAEKVHG